MPKLLGYYNKTLASLNYFTVNAQIANSRIIQYKKCKISNKRRLYHKLSDAAFLFLLKLFDEWLNLFFFD